MPDISGIYRFLPWARSGLAAASSVKTSDGRLTLHVKLDVLKGASDTDFVEQDLRLYGPGDVVGLDGKQIIRREPPPGTSDFEPNYFPLVEFDAPELPWLFSPELDPHRVRPWLTLVVIRRENAEVHSDPRRPLPYLSLAKDVALQELPDLDEAWAWAHVQLTGDREPPAALDGEHPELTLSRIVCPRRLEQKQRYRACLVPVYRAGVQASLGQPVDAGAALAWPSPGDTEGWKAISGPLELPIYDQWEFTTAEVGDFEMLVRRLRAKVVGPEIGGLDLDISNPDPAFSGLHIGPSTTLPFEGALTSPELPDHAWPKDGGDPELEDRFKKQLEELIKADPDAGTTVLRPPIYGAFHAEAAEMIEKLPEPGAADPWVRDLNLDPAWRAAAAIGTRVVQQLQEELMASAWDQAGELERANTMLRQAELARATAAATLDKHLSGLSADSIARVTEPLHSRVRLKQDDGSSSKQTLHGTVKNSRFPVAALSPPVRRALRTGGPLEKRLPKNAKKAASVMSVSLAAGNSKVRVRPAKGGARFDEVTKKIPGGQQQFADLGKYSNVPPGSGWKKVSKAAGDGEDSFYTGADPYESSSSSSPSPPPTPPPTPEPTPITAAAASAATELEPTPLEPNDGGSGASDPTADRLKGINDRFKGATDLFWKYLQKLPVSDEPSEPRPELPLDGIGDQLKSRKGVLNPDHTVAREVIGLVDGPRATAVRAAAARAETPPVAADASPDLRPRAATPYFPQPMVEQLLSIDRELLLPGVDRIELDTVGLLFGNRRFIEAFMVGVNHELSRELLWRGLPADLSATFADRFWDIRGRLEKGDTTRQIPEIAGWSGGLGDNAIGVGEHGMLVLIIRGRLLQRYPHTSIYAAKAVAGAGALPVPGSEERYPLFRGRIDPDVTYLGFGLSEETARKDIDGLGWFFVIQEQPTAPRFGLDEPDQEPLAVSWANLDWSDVVEDAKPPPSHVRVAGPLAASSTSTPPREAKTLPVLETYMAMTATWGADAAHMAAITYQRPMRVAIHANTMLPEEKKQEPTP